MCIVVSQSIPAPKVLAIVKLLGEFVITLIPVPPVKVAGARVPPEFKNPTDLTSIITPLGGAVAKVIVLPESVRVLTFWYRPFKYTSTAFKSTGVIPRA